MSANKEINSKKLGLKGLSVILAIVTALGSLFLFAISFVTYSTSQKLQNSTNEYIESQLAAARLKQGSDNLTKHVRSFVVTGKVKSLDYYLVEYNETKTYDNARDKLKEMVNQTNLEYSLDLIDDYENKIKQLDGQAIQLACKYYDIDTSLYEEYFKQYPLSAYQKSLTNEDQYIKAVNMVFSAGTESAHYGDYDMYKRIVDDNIESFNRQLASSIQNEQLSNMRTMQVASFLLRVTALLLLLLVMFDVVAVLKYVVAPLLNNINHINKNEYLDEKGVTEMKYLATSYNSVFAKVNETHKRLSYEASHDQLTGLLNRQAYYDTNLSHELKDICLLHIDVDNFKDVNDNHGHDVGDKVLRKVSETLLKHFRSGDLIYRLGGDEFVAILINIVPENKDIVKQKIEQIVERLKNTDDGLPPVTVSIGGSFAKDNKDLEALYKQADLALYKAKSSGKNTIMFYDEINN